VRGDAATVAGAALTGAAVGVTATAAARGLGALGLARARGRTAAVGDFADARGTNPAATDWSIDARPIR
jgi:hypothetical protein